MADQSHECVALNADVVDYSKLMADDFEATTSTLEQYHSLVDETVSKDGGTLVNFVGDNFMAIFDDAISAVKSAIAISTEIEAHNAEVPKPRQMRFRMGIDQGEIHRSDGQYFGDALNIAARIQAIAPAGGLSVSGSVYEALDEPGLRFRALGRRALKNIPEEIEVYEFLDLPGDTAGVSKRSSLSLEPPTVAVLPFHTERIEEQIRPAVEVIRSDLIHRLTRVPQLRTLDAQAGPDDTKIDARARYTLESGVHQVGDGIRIYVNLIDAASWNVVKSGRWTTDLNQLLDLSESIADEVANMIEVELIIGEPAGLYAEIGDAAAMEKINRGWYELTKGTPEGLFHALELFDEVATAHPDKPHGHVLSAFAKLVAFSIGLAEDPEDLLARADEQARTATEIGDPTGIAQAVKAAVLMSQGKGEKAIEAIESAETARPTCDVTYGLEGSMRRYMGQWNQAVNLLDHAMRLTAVNKPWYPTVKACSLFMGGRIENAASTAERVLEHQPNNLEALLVLTAAQVELGLERRAKANAELIRERFASVDVSEWLERNPYQDRAIIDRWREDLEEAGVLGSV